MSTNTYELKPGGARVHRDSLGSVLALIIAASACLPALGQAAENPGVQIVKDPATGELRAPTHQEFKALEKQAKKTKGKSLGLISGHPVRGPVHRPDGSVSMELDESSMAYSVMTRNADGSMNFNCVTGADTAEQLVEGKKVSAAKMGHSHDHQ